MPEPLADKYAQAVPSFIIGNLPTEFTADGKPPAPKEPEVKVEPAAPVVKDEAKPVAEAATTEPVKEGQEVGKDDAKETTGKDPEKATTRRFERRIDRAIRARAEAQAEAELLKKEVAELKAKSAPAALPGAPRMEEFTDVQEYAKAYAKFETDNAAFCADCEADGHGCLCHRDGGHWRHDFDPQGCPPDAPPRRHLQRGVYQPDIRQSNIHDTGGD